MLAVLRHSGLPTTTDYSEGIVTATLSLRAGPVRRRLVRGTVHLSEQIGRPVRTAAAYLLVIALVTTALIARVVIARLKRSAGRSPCKKFAPVRPRFFRQIV